MIQEQLNQLATDIRSIRDLLTLESRRTEYLVALQEGLVEKRQLLAAARLEPDFQAVYAKANPLVTVCVSTFNRPHLLVDRCVRSLLRQSYRNIQVVVVGDGCTDETEYRISQVRDSRLHFENLPQRGPYPPPGMDRWCVAGTMATNRALDLAEGDFVAHLDDDDEADIERCEILVQAALETKAEFLWHRFMCETPTAEWTTLGEPDLRLGTVTTGSIFYHRYFRAFKWDPFAFRWKEPGDWNRIRKIKFVGARTHFVDRILTLHYREGQQPKFTQLPGETYLD